MSAKECREDERKRRFIACLEAWNICPKDLSVSTGISLSLCHKYHAGKVFPTSNNLSLILKAFPQINPNYLLLIN